MESNLTHTYPKSKKFSSNNKPKKTLTPTPPNLSHKTNIKEKQREFLLK